MSETKRKRSMRKYIYIAVTLEKEGKFFSYTLAVHTSQNLLSALKKTDIKCAMYFDSKQRCQEVCSIWNKQYKENGEYLYE